MPSPKMLTYFTFFFKTFLNWSYFISDQRRVWVGPLCIMVNSALFIASAAITCTIFSQSNVNITSDIGFVAPAIYFSIFPVEQTLTSSVLRQSAQNASSEDFARDCLRFALLPLKLPSRPSLHETENIANIYKNISFNCVKDLAF
jgi:hypothetical protein